MHLRHESELGNAHVRVELDGSGILEGTVQFGGLEKVQEKEKVKKKIRSGTSSFEDQAAVGEGAGDQYFQRRHPQRKRRVLLAGLAKGVISVVLIVWLVSTVDLSNLMQRLLGVPYGTLFLAGFLEVVAVGIAAWRWKFVLGALELSTGYGAVFRLFYIGQFINQVLPANIGGDIFRTWSVFREGSGILRALMAVALDRLVALVGLALLVVPGLYFLTGITDDVTPFWILFAFVLGVVAGVVLFLVFGVLTLPRRLLTISGLGGLMAWINEASIFARAVLMKWRTAIPVITLAVAVHGLAVISILVLAEGLGIPLTAGAAFALIPPVILASVIPISYAGWGVREGAMVVFLDYAGMAPEAAISLSLLFGGVNLLVSLPAAIFWLGASELRAHDS